ncbi:hypothetical protein [Nocardioides sp.]|uniref:hypothetical protein n=1 Tax=Nocardioides sp. TaxID=35761 RepID=UPI002C28F657|nr:hypothetical protein [Nocardioides sp.]HSX66675.1 hypothetical protein [Nocardioides sp.]
MAGPIKIAVLADTKDLAKGMDRAEAAMKSAERTASSAGRKIESSFDGVAEASDNLASGSAQAAGGLGDLGGALSLMPGPLGGVGAGMEALAPAIMGVTGAADLLNLATGKFPILAKISTAASKAMALGIRAVGVAVRFATGPFGLVMLAIAAVVAIMVVAYKRSDTFRAIVDKAFAAIKRGAALLWAGIKLYFGLWIGAIKGVINFAGTLKSKVTGGFDAVVKFIKGVPATIAALGGKFKEAGSGLMHKIVDGIKAAAGFIGDIASGIWNAVKSLLNQGIDKINAALEFDINLGVKTFHVNAPNIPHLANGGITTGPTFALIGDNPGGREAVIPLDKYDLGGGDTYNINVVAPVGSSSADIGRVIVQHITAYERAGGRRRA